MKVHHLGYAVKNIDKAKHQFEVLGFTTEGNVINDDSRNIQIQFMINGNERIELVSPLPGTNPVNSVLQKNGPIPYHICYEVDDIQKTIEEMEKLGGWICFSKPQNAPAIQGRLVAFLMNKHVGIVELVEE